MLFRSHATQDLGCDATRQFQSLACGSVVAFNRAWKGWPLRRAAGIAVCALSVVGVSAMGKVLIRRDFRSRRVLRESGKFIDVHCIPGLVAIR